MINIIPLSTIIFLIISNLFMTFAWYGHLKGLSNKPLYFVIIISWFIAFFEYCFQVPANRIGYSYYTLPQLKILQEVITLMVFMVFSMSYMGVKPTINFLWAGLCLLGAIYFIFND